MSKRVLSEICNILCSNATLKPQEHSLNYNIQKAIFEHNVLPFLNREHAFKNNTSLGLFLYKHLWFYLGNNQMSTEYRNRRRQDCMN